MNTSSQSNGKILAITGAICQVGPVVGLLGTIFGMVRAFGVLSSSGTSDPRALSGTIATVLLMTMIGFIVGIVGVVLLCIALTASCYRAKWFFWFLMIYGTLLIFSYPYGTLFGIFFLVYSLMKRVEFFPLATPIPEDQVPSASLDQP